ncbi:APC family permease [Priestia sp. SIMBA_032]|uniref:APC family permease n=1 Tax=Priestia sp. SIMBA_032 TaxID=3085775 RepID=UPI00397C7B76
MKGLPELKRSLNIRYVILFGLSFMAPVTVFSTYGIAINQTHGMIPTAYIIALIVMLFTSYSYAKMVQVYPSSGSAYTFVQKGINSHLGFLVGWVILLDYLFSPMISALLFGVMVNAYFPGIPIVVCIISFIIVVTAINILGIKVAANVNTFLVLFQVLFIIVFCLFCINGLISGKGTGELFTKDPFFSPDVNFNNLISIVPLLCFSFLGFDAVTTLAEETKKPKQTLPRAIYATTLIGGLLFIISTYFAQSIFQNSNTFKNPDTAIVEIMIYTGGNFLNSLFISVVVIASTASAIASGGSGARILYAMGRDSVLPKKIFGYISPRFQTPIYNILIISCIAMSAVFLDIATATSFINFGALFAFTFVNFSVIVHYFVKNKQVSFRSIVLNLLIPLTGTGITILFITRLNIHSLVLGITWLVVGFIYLLYLTKMFKKRPPELNFEEPKEEFDVKLVQ